MGSNDLITGALGIAILVPLAFLAFHIVVWIWPIVPLAGLLALVVLLAPKR